MVIQSCWRVSRKWPSNSDKRGNAAKPIKEVPMDEYEETDRPIENHPLIGTKLGIRIDKLDLDCTLSVESVWIDEEGDISVYGLVSPLVEGLDHLEAPIEYTNTIH
jgi:hypothetical protein